MLWNPHKHAYNVQDTRHNYFPFFLWISEASKLCQLKSVYGEQDRQLLIKTAH